MLHRLMLGLLWTGLATVSASFRLADQGRTAVVILQQPGASVPEQKAAKDLADTLRQITGASFEVRSSETALPPSAILVGAGPAARQLFPEVRFDELGAEEIIVQTRGNYLLLAGGRPRGTLYAVYWFLQEYVGARWWTPWATTLPQRPNLKIPELERRLKPAYESRDPFWFPAFNREWAVRNFSNSQSAGLTEGEGGCIRYKGFVHTFYPLVPPDKYFKEHPEWYSLLKGKRTANQAQLCLTNPKLRDFVVERVKQWLRESPDARIISVSQNDWYGACECPECKALDDAEGSHAGTMLTFVNYIAAQIAAEFPQVAVDTLAYQYTRKAPKTIKPLPNVIVRLCSIECNFAAPLTDPSNASFAQDLRDWSRICQRLYVWDYTTDFGHYVQPHPNWFVLGPNVRFYNQNHVVGLFEQGAYQSNGSEMSELRAWVLARLLWNPQLDDRKLIREFLENYYGRAAAHPIQEYMQLMQQAAKGFYLSCFSPADAPFLKFKTLAQAERLWQQAEATVRADPEKLWRVRQGHLPVRYSWLTRWQSLQREAYKAGVPWPLPASRKQVADEWLAVATGPGPAGWAPMTHLNESGLKPQDFVARFATDPAAFKLNNLPPQGKGGLRSSDRPMRRNNDLVELQEDQAQLVREGELTEIRPDPQASDGFAVRMPGSHREWAFQFKAANLPAQVRQGKWLVQVCVRVEKGPAAPAETAAFEAGVWDGDKKMSLGHRLVKVGETDPAYRNYELGTVEFPEHSYLWIAPAANPQVQSVWVDRVILKRVKR